MIGTTIAGYRIIEKLGEGGMGVVYKAVDTTLDRVVAIKALSAELAKNPELEQRFRAEARAQASLNHVNLATLYAFLVEGGTAWMVMEFIEGESFASMIQRRGPIPSQASLPLFRQALLGLGYAHRMGIVHRDIKPGNIMLNHQGIVKVMDFGIAKVMGGRSMTRTGTQMGTAWYMAPEQVMNKGVDIRSDIYALGVTLYEMLSGRVPFESDSDYEVMTDHVNTPPPPPTQFYPYIPAGAVNAVLKALAKNPNDRFQTTEEFGAALESPDSFVWTPAAVAGAGAVAPAAVAGAVGALGSPAGRPTSAPTMPFGAAAVTQPPVAVPPTPPKAGGLKPLYLALIALGVVALGAGAAYLTFHPPFHPKNGGGTSLAPITSNTGGSTDTGSHGQVEIPNNPVPGAPASPNASNGSGSIPQNPPPGAPQQPPQQQHQQQQAAPSASAVVIPAGTAITVRTIDVIKTGKSFNGQRFAASVEAPVLANGSVAIPRGANAQVEVVESAESGHFKGRPVLELRLVSVAVQGRLKPVASDTVAKEGLSRGKTTAAVVGGAAAVGGAIGGIFHHKRGAAEGAAAGAGAGAGAEAATRGEVEIPSETKLDFHLRSAVPVS